MVQPGTFKISKVKHYRKTEETGDFSSIDLYKMEIMLEDEKKYANSCIKRNQCVPSRLSHSVLPVSCFSPLQQP
jgi:hypothetical protein